MLTPYMVVYERTASNDVLIASLFVLAYVLAAGRSVARTVVAGVLCGLIAWVKPTAYVLLPMVVAGVWSARKTRWRLCDLAWFLGVFGVTVALRNVTLGILLRPDMAASGLTAAELIRKTTSHYGLPDLTKVERVFCGITSFPRQPTGTLLACWTVLLTVLPLSVLAFCVARGKRWLAWNYRLVLYVMVPAYCFAVAIIWTYYTHYLIPVMLFSPVLWLEARKDLRRAGNDAPKWLMPVLVTMAAVAGFCFTLPQVPAKAMELVQKCASNQYNLPQQSVWHMTWPQMLTWALPIWAVCVAGIWLWIKKRANAIVRIALVLPCVVTAVSICFAAIPMGVLAPYMRQPVDAILLNIRLCLSLATALVLCIWICPRMVSRRKFWYGLIGCGLVLSAVICPTWRQGIKELAERRFLYRDAATAITQALPLDAILISERAPQLMLASPVRASSTFLANCNPMPLVNAATDKMPEVPLFAALDPGSYNMQHFQNAKMRFSQVLTVKLPSTGTGQPVDVYVVRLYPAPQKK